MGIEVDDVRRLYGKLDAIEANNASRFEGFAVAFAELSQRFQIHMDDEEKSTAAFREELREIRGDVASIRANAKLGDARFWRYIAGALAASFLALASFGLKVAYQNGAFTPGAF